VRAMQIIEWGKPLKAREYPDAEPQGEEDYSASRRRGSATATCTSGTGTSIWEAGSRSRSNRAACAFTIRPEMASEVIGCCQVKQPQRKPSRD
jgi:hypothetical protein